jgi:hypothetical protein
VKQAKIAGGLRTQQPRRLDAALTLVQEETRPAASAPPPGLFTARLKRATSGAAVLEHAGKELAASVDPSVHPQVLAGAALRGERVLVERSDDGELLVIGALRTQPTPGIDVADAYEIKAGRVAIEATGEISLAAQTAGLVIRAASEIETYADRIISRAEGVHKIIGRMLRLN